MMALTNLVAANLPARLIIRSLKEPVLSLDIKIPPSKSYIHYTNTNASAFICKPVFGINSTKKVLALQLYQDVKTRSNLFLIEIGIPLEIETLYEKSFHTVLTV